jgi:hypothetical protein
MPTFVGAVAFFFPPMTTALWSFAIACCVTGSVMIAYAIKILRDAYGANRG